MKRCLLTVKIVALMFTLLLSFLMNVSASAVDQTDLQTYGSLPFQISNLEGMNGNTNLIFVYTGSISEENIEVNLYNEDSYSNSCIISKDNTAAEFSNVELNSPYNLTVLIDNETVYTVEIELLDDAEIDATIYDVDGAIISPTNNAIRNSRAAGEFQAKTSQTGSAIGSSTHSLWVAIERASKSSSSTACVIQTSNNTVVWAKSSVLTYYKYQFDTYYGSTTSSSNANSWIDGYNYSHIIDSLGRASQAGATKTQKYDYCQNLKGNPYNSRFVEQNNGAYYYNWSSSNDAKKISTTFDLSNYEFTESSTETSQIWNGFMFLSFKQQNKGTTFEAGLVCYGDGQSGDIDKIYPVVTYYDATTHLRQEWMPTNASNVIAHGTQSGNTGNFSDIIHVSMEIKSDNSVLVTWYNASEDIQIEYDVPNPYVNYSDKHEWATAVAYVTNADYAVPQQLNDLRNGGAMRNVKMKNTTLYIGSNQYSYTPDSPYSLYAFAYNTDCITYSKSGSVETINIFFDRS